MNHTSRVGLTLAEILVAMLLFTVGALGLAASSASLAKQMSWNADRFRAASLATSRIERMSAVRCQSTSGSDVSGRVQLDWAAAAGIDLMAVDGTLRRLDSRGPHVSLLRAGSLCR